MPMAIHEKHLDLVQGVINRLAGNGFLIKAWSVTVAVAMIAVIARTGSTALGPALVIPVIAFWGLDGYFLSRERGFCSLYRRIVQHDESVPPYSMDIERIDLRAWWRACWRMTLIAFHGTVLLMVGASMLLLLSNQPLPATSSHPLNAGCASPPASAEPADIGAPARPANATPADHDPHDG